MRDLLRDVWTAARMVALEIADQFYRIRWRHRERRRRKHEARRCRSDVGYAEAAAWRQEHARRATDLLRDGLVEAELSYPSFTILSEEDESTPSGSTIEVRWADGKCECPTPEQMWDKMKDMAQREARMSGTSPFGR